MEILTKKVILANAQIVAVKFPRSRSSAKVRDLVEAKDGVAWPKFSQELGLAAEENYILESRGRDRKKIEAEIKDGTFQNKYWDGRIFGNTFLEEGGPDSVKAGVVQFGLGLSVAPIEVERLTTTNKAGVQSGKDRGMAPLGYRVVRHAVYCMPFFVNPNMAYKTGCTEKDIQLLKKLIPFAYPLNRAYNRTQVEVRHAWYIEHNDPLGSCSDFKLLEALTPSKRTDRDKPSTSWEDYLVPTSLPENLASKVKPLRDLMEEAYGTARS